MTTHLRRESDHMRTDIDALILKANNVETKELLNLFRNMDDKLQDIALTLHAQNDKRADYELKISKVLTSLEERIANHELDYNANKVKSNEWKRIINAVSVFAFTFCAWAGAQYFDLHDAKEKTDQRLIVMERDLIGNVNEIRDLKAIIDKMQIDIIKHQVTELEKKNSKIERLSVIQNSK